MPDDRSRTGSRIAAHAPHLRLLLHALAGRAVRARVDVDDLLQEVFLRAVTSGALPKDDAALRRLLTTMARHVVIDVARSARARKRGGDRPIALVRGDWSQGGFRESRVADGDPGPATLAVRSEDDRRLLAAFDGLAADHRRVITLRQLQGLTAAEAAARMGRTEAAVHSLYRRALQAWSNAVGD